MNNQTHPEVPASQPPQYNESLTAPDAPVITSHNHKIFFWLVALALFSVALAGVYLWQNQKVADLNTKIEKLNIQASDLNKQITKLEAAAVTPTPTPKATPVNVVSSGGTKFSGIITADGCVGSNAPAGDVGCSIKINSTITITVAHGNVAQTQPWGSLINFPAHPTDPTGKTVEVYAHQIDKTTYTLGGSAGYYVKITN